jgi:hypothetical protein
MRGILYSIDTKSAVKNIADGPPHVASPKFTGLYLGRGEFNVPRHHPRLAVRGYH